MTSLTLDVPDAAEDGTFGREGGVGSGAIVGGGDVAGRAGEVAIGGVLTGGTVTAEVCEVEGPSAVEVHPAAARTMASITSQRADSVNRASSRKQNCDPYGSAESVHRAHSLRRKASAKCDKGE
jgi:hypothetical protein